jgi:Mn2+/Fe2+ NRAMP family transporter
MVFLGVTCFTRVHCERFDAMDGIKVQLGLTDLTTQAIGEALARRRTTGRANLLFAGPAVLASIASVDPGNFATNLRAGARYGYTLLWMVLSANIVAMLFQALSAKLGIVTNRNLVEMCRERFPAMAGQVIMQGFVGFRILVWLRRIATMVPSLVAEAFGVKPTGALVYSQVVLSFVLPVPMIAWVVLPA